MLIFSVHADSNCAKLTLDCLYIQLCWNKVDNETYVMIWLNEIVLDHESGFIFSMFLLLGE